MYGGHLALNHLKGANEVNLAVLTHLIDYPSTNEHNITKMIHIHVFHSDEMFSKFAFKDNKYNNLTVNHLLTGQVKYYALKNALDAKRMTELQLYDLYLNATAS
jgi:hypothetical protein